MISARSQSPSVKQRYSFTRMSATPSSARSGILASTAAWRAVAAVEPVDRVDVEPDDGVGVLLGDLLDVDAALRRQHQQVLLGRPVEREAGVVLLVDVGGVLDPHPLHDVALDVHAEDVAGVRADLVGVVGQLDAAGLAAAADLHLGLDDDRVAGGFGLRDRLVDGVGHAAGADRDAVAGEVLLALVLEQIHWSPRLGRGAIASAWAQASRTLGGDRGSQPTRSQTAWRAGAAYRSDGRTGDAVAPAALPAGARRGPRARRRGGAGADLPRHVGHGGPHRRR